MEANSPMDNGDKSPPQPPASAPHRQREREPCAICFEEKDASSFPNLPCCGRGSTVNATSSVKICMDCLLILLNNENHVGRCPRCREVIHLTRTSDDIDDDRAGDDGEGDGGGTAADTITDSGSTTRGYSVRVGGVPGVCRMCRQRKERLVDMNLCDACHMGMGNTLIYECDSCHGFQRIPHPMYRYQPTVEEFSTATWACHVRCGDYTHWRIRPDQVERVPLEDVPESWGEVVDYMEQARVRVREARAQWQRRHDAAGRGVGGCIVG